MSRYFNIIFAAALFTGVVSPYSVLYAQEQEQLIDAQQDSFESFDLPQPNIDQIQIDTLPELVVEQVEIELDPTLEPVPTEALEPPVDDLNVIVEDNMAADQLSPNMASTPAAHSGTYFDASSIGPSDLTNSDAPREVDPRFEPGSSFVVVRQAAGPNSFSSRIVAARRALSLERYAAAIEMYEQLYKDFPKSHEVLMGLAVAQQQNGFTESAIATYEELLKHEPNNADAMANMLGLIKSQYPAVAYRRLQDLWQKNPNSPHIASELGMISASVQEYSEAVRYLDVAASLEPDNATHFYNLAVIYDRAGESKNAIEMYQKALQVDASYGGARTLDRDQVYDRLAQLRRM